MCSSTVPSHNKNNTLKFFKIFKYSIIFYNLKVSVDFNSITLLLSKLTLIKVLLVNIILALIYLIYFRADFNLFKIYFLK